MSRNDLKVKAEERIAFTAEEYTQSDRLLSEDEQVSLTEKITDFATEVKNAANGDDCSKIVQVIPRQYMKFAEEHAVFRYNGKEYGFYAVKKGTAQRCA